MPETLGSCGAPGRIRTCDPLIRSQILYPAELQAPKQPGIYINLLSGIQEFFFGSFIFFLTALYLSTCQ